jgi:hypothetical protein
MSPEPDATLPVLVDRRRQPRVGTSGGLRLSIPFVSSGEVVDISTIGALISTSEPLAVGERARLSALMGREPFGAWVKVIRVDEGTRSGGQIRHHLGVVFVGIDENSRQVLSRFVPHDDPARS